VEQSSDAVHRALFVDCNDQLAPVLEDVRREVPIPLSVNQAPFASEDLPGLLAGYGIALIDHSYLPTEIAARCAGLRYVVFLGTGASSYMDVAALSALGIEVHTIKGYGDTAVAEHAVALMFSCARDVALMDHEVRKGVWTPREGVQLHGKRLGIVGLGGIGAEVARIGTGIGMSVAYWNRTPRPDVAWPAMELDALLGWADVVSLHLGLNEETRGLIDARRLGLMRRGVILVNTARGALVDEAALVAALRDGRLRAGLDVFGREPLRTDDPLAGCEAAVLTAHAGFRTYEASATLLRRALEIAQRLIG
jgi:D-3-phosphoglycerate dehydrogenase